MLVRKATKELNWVVCPDCCDDEADYYDNAEDFVPCETCNPDWEHTYYNVKDFLDYAPNIGVVVAEYAEKWDTAKRGICEGCHSERMVVKVDGWYEDTDNEPDHAWLCAECVKDWASEYEWVES